MVARVCCARQGYETSRLRSLVWLLDWVMGGVSMRASVLLFFSCGLMSCAASVPQRERAAVPMPRESSHVAQAPEIAEVQAPAEV